MDNFKKLNLKQLKIPISVEYTLDEDVEIIPASYLSIDGMFAETTLDYEEGVNLVIRFYLPEFDRVIEAVGEVVYKVKESEKNYNGWNVPGIFIKFKAMDSEDRAILQSYLQNNVI